MKTQKNDKMDKNDENDKNVIRLKLKYNTLKCYNKMNQKKTILLADAGFEHIPAVFLPSRFLSSLALRMIIYGDLVTCFYGRDNLANGGLRCMRTHRTRITREEIRLREREQRSIV